MALVDVVGWLAGALVLATFYLKTMIPLRTVAVVSNIAFAVYGLMVGAIPIVVLHCLLLPLNAIRLYEMRTLIKRVKRASRGNLSMEMLVPYMKISKVPAGTTLFSIGDYAEDLFLIMKGRVRIEGKGVLLKPGQLLGEMGLFTPGQKRTGTAVCETEVEYASVNEDRIWEMFYQNPEFGAYLLRLIVLRSTAAPAAEETPITITGVTA